MLKKLLKKEEEKYGHILYPFKTIPIKSFEELMQNYNVYEATVHWYDSSPNECHDCKKSSCKNCNAYNKWNGSYEQLIFNNWVDLNGPGIWNESQEEVNNWVKILFTQEILKYNGFKDRLFWYQPADKNYFYLFYLYRDIERFDYWFIFERKVSLK